MAKRADERYQQIDELLTDLRSPKKITASRPSVPSRTLRFNKKWYIYASVFALLIVLAFTGIHFFPKSTQAINSIAVLPLQNLSGDPEQEYFADGMTEALIANLAKIKSLRVISRTSVMQFKNTRDPLPEIAKKLNVDAVVEGSVSRAGDRVRVTAQLIDAQTDRHLWAKEYSRNLRDVLFLQSEVTESIVGELRLNLTSQEQQRIVNLRPVEAEAYQFYLKGRSHVHNYLDFEKAIACFQQAINIDQSFGGAYAALASSYLGMRITLTSDVHQELFIRAKAAAVKALELDETIGEVYAVLGDIKFIYEWDWYGAEQEYSRALSLDPQNTEVLKRYADYLVLMGRFDEGIALQKRAINLDPLSAMYSITLGWTLFYARRYDEGITHLRRMLLLYPNESTGVNYQIAWCYVMRSMYADAINAGEIAGDQTTLAYIYAVSGNRKRARKVLTELLEVPTKEQRDPFLIAIIYAGLDDKEQAFNWLNKAYHERSIFIPFIKTEPTLDALRSDPRFLELCRKVGLEKTDLH